MDDEVCRLREENEKLAAQLAEARQTIEALTSGQLDSVVGPGRTTPVLLEAAQAKLVESQRLFRAVFDGALDAIVLANDEGRYVDANPAACELFGLDRDKLVGRSVADFADPVYATDDAWRDFQSAGHMVGTFRLVRPDGTKRETDFRATANIQPGLHLSVMRDVTEQLAVEGALQKTEELLATVAANAPITLFATDSDGAYTLHEGNGLARLGVRPGELVGTSAFERYRAWPFVVECLRRCLAGEEIREVFELGDLAFASTLIPIRAPSGAVTGVTGVAVDITERARAEAALHASEARFRAMIEKSQDGISLLDENMRTIYQSPAVERLFGYSTEDAKQMTWQQFVPEDDVAKLEKARTTVLSAPSAHISIEFRMRHRNGSLRWTELSATNMLHDPDVRAIVTNFRDITERRAFDDKLRASEERYRRIVEGTSEGILMGDAEGRLTFANTRVAEMLGYSPEEMVGQSAYAFMDPEGARQTKSRLETRRGGKTDSYEHRFLRRDGTPVWARVSGTPLRDASGRFEGTLALVSDITAERRAAEVRTRMAAIVEQSQDAIISTDLHETITSWNRAAEVLYQYTASEILGRSLSILVPAGLEDAEAEIVAQVAQGKSVEHHETRRRRKDGSVIEVEVSASPIRDPDGRVIGVSRILRDLTERRKAEASLRRIEEQLHQAQKMEAIAALAGGVAHDFNNLLTVVLSYAALVLDDLKPGDPIRADLEDIQSAGRRASELTRQLLAFGRQQILQPRLVDLHEVVLGIRRVMERTVREDIELTILSGGKLDKVFVDPGQVEQVVLNLVVNARDAMPTGGRLTIDMSNAVLDDTYAAEHPGVTPGPYVLLAVTDDGVGMDAATQARIFEPFFSTKDKAKGSGLGLSSVFGIVRQSGGHIYVYSELGVGTTFKVYFPRASGPAVAPTVMPTQPGVATGSETVLLVEDEDQVRRTIRTILRKHGYNVLEATNGGEALLISEQYTAKIHLLLTDVVMPRMSGRQLAERLTKPRPEMRVLFMSGYTDDSIVHHGVLDAGVSFLQKPVTPATLTGKVREVLDGPRSRPH